MNTEQAMRAAVEQAGMSMNKVSRAMGRNDNFLSATLSRGSTPKADTLAAMLEVCGYRLAAVPYADVPDTALVIDPPESAG